MTMQTPSSNTSAPEGALGEFAGSERSISSRIDCACKTDFDLLTLLRSMSCSWSSSQHCALLNTSSRSGILFPHSENTSARKYSSPSQLQHGEYTIEDSPCGSSFLTALTFSMCTARPSLLHASCMHPLYMDSMPHILSRLRLFRFLVVRPTFICVFTFTARPP